MIFSDKSIQSFRCRSLLAQSISEVMSAPETRWSPTTAVRAFFRHLEADFNWCMASGHSES